MDPQPEIWRNYYASAVSKQLRAVPTEVGEDLARYPPKVLGLVCETAVAVEMLQRSHAEHCKVIEEHLMRIMEIVRATKDGSRGFKRFTGTLKRFADDQPVFAAKVSMLATISHKSQLRASVLARGVADILELQPEKEDKISAILARVNDDLANDRGEILASFAKDVKSEVGDALLKNLYATFGESWGGRDWELEEEKPWTSEAFIGAMDEVMEQLEEGGPAKKGITMQGEYDFVDMFYTAVSMLLACYGTFLLAASISKETGDISSWFGWMIRTQTDKHLRRQEAMSSAASLAGQEILSSAGIKTKGWPYIALNMATAALPVGAPFKATLCFAGAFFMSNSIGDLLRTAEQRIGGDSWISQGVEDRTVNLIHFFSTTVNNTFVDLFDFNFKDDHGRIYNPNTTEVDINNRTRDVGAFLPYAVTNLATANIGTGNNWVWDMAQSLDQYVDEAAAPYINPKNVANIEIALATATFIIQPGPVAIATSAAYLANYIDVPEGLRIAAGILGAGEPRPGGELINVIGMGGVIGIMISKHQHFGLSGLSLYLFKNYGATFEGYTLQQACGVVAALWLTCTYIRNNIRNHLNGFGEVDGSIGMELVAQVIQNGLDADIGPSMEPLLGGGRRVTLIEEFQTVYYRYLSKSSSESEETARQRWGGRWRKFGQLGLGTAAVAFGVGAELSAHILACLVLGDIYTFRAYKTSLFKGEPELNLTPGSYGLSARAIPLFTVGSMVVNSVFMVQLVPYASQGFMTGMQYIGNAEGLKVLAAAFSRKGIPSLAMWTYDRTGIEVPGIDLMNLKNILTRTPGGTGSGTAPLQRTLQNAPQTLADNVIGSGRDIGNGSSGAGQLVQTVVADRSTIFRSRQEAIDRVNVIRKPNRVYAVFNFLNARNMFGIAEIASSGNIGRMSTKDEKIKYAKDAMKNFLRDIKGNYRNVKFTDKKFDAIVEAEFFNTEAMNSDHYENFLTINQVIEYPSGDDDGILKIRYKTGTTIQGEFPFEQFEVFV